MRRLVTLAAAATAALLIAAPALAARSSTSPKVMHVGSTGQQVRDLQWLLGAHRPSVYKIRAWRHPVDGRYTPALAQAVRNMKWRLGYPRARVTGTAGKLLFSILEGKKPRPRQWIGFASRRAQPPPAKPTTCSKRVIGIAAAELGVHEIPDGSNNGPRVHEYERSTGAYGLPWCASFAQRVLQWAGIGTIADASAGVFHIIEWSRQRGYLRAVPKPGMLVGFLQALGHMGIVQTIEHTGFYSIEGNHSNSVARVFHPFGDKLTVFVSVPGCS